MSLLVDALLQGPQCSDIGILIVALDGIGRILQLSSVGLRWLADVTALQLSGPIFIFFAGRRSEFVANYHSCAILA